MGLALKRLGLSQTEDNGTRDREKEYSESDRLGELVEGEVVEVEERTK